MSSLIEPHGGALVDLFVPDDERAEYKAYAGSLASLQLTPRQVSDLELLAGGAFSPLDRLMGQDDYVSVLENMRLKDGSVFPVPITLPAHPGGAISQGADIALRDPHNNLLAIMSIEEVYPWDATEMARRVFGASSSDAPAVLEMARWQRANISGPLRMLARPIHHDAADLRLGPAAVRRRLRSIAIGSAVAYHGGAPMHRAQEDLARRVAAEAGAPLLLQPMVDDAREGWLDPYALVRAYRAMEAHLADDHPVLLALLPLGTRAGTVRQAILQALVARNYGADRLILGAEYGVLREGVRANGEGAVLDRLTAELGVRLIPADALVYLPREGRYEEARQVPEGAETATLPDAEMRSEYLDRGRPLPVWFTRPEVAEILAQAHPPRHRQGFCVWLTGLSGAGKSTIAEIVTVRLQERGRQVTLLDGDVVRTHLSRGLGFSKADRDANIRRIGYVAAEIVRHGGVAVCAAVSPYRTTRNEVRAMVGAERFIEVFLDTPLDVCEARDVKGLYAQARRGDITGFTGIDDPYEPPLHPEVVLRAVDSSADENAAALVRYLEERGFLLGRSVVD